MEFQRPSVSELYFIKSVLYRLVRTKLSILKFRLVDLQERGSRLAALKCLTKTCKGSMFPLQPLEAGSEWQCELCGRQMTGRQASLTQATLGRLLSVVDGRNAAQMERFLSEHHHVMPSTNQILVEVKCNLIRCYGHTKGYSWTGEFKVKLTGRAFDPLLQRARVEVSPRNFWLKEIKKQKNL